MAWFCRRGVAWAAPDVGVRCERVWDAIALVRGSLVAQVKGPRRHQVVRLLREGDRHRGDTDRCAVSVVHAEDGLCAFHRSVHRSASLARGE